MIRSIVSSLLLITFLFFIVCSAFLWLKNKMLTNKLVQSEIDKEVMVKYFLEELEAKPYQDDQVKDDFIKFLSDSRDWSYSYIEEVQSGIGRFIDKIEPEISYFDEYGIVGDAYPHYFSMKKISEAYKELKTLMPEDYGKLD